MSVINHSITMKEDQAFIANTYARNELVLTRGKGSWVNDENGNRYLDFTSGIGVNSLGFCDDEWVKAVYEQLQKLQHISNLYYTEPGVRLAKALCQRTNMKKAFFANSGAEANEGAIKAARKYSSDQYGKNRYKIITLEGSFHGRTLTALTATGQADFHKHFAPFVEGFVCLPSNDFVAMQNYIDQNNDVCAIMIEVIQGEGGVVPLDKDYVKNIADLCKEKDILLIVDEVQTGIGRTGSILALEDYGITADLVTLAKGIGSGLPIGVVLFGEKTKNTFGYSDHGSTFGANPVVCAGGLEVMRRLTPEFLAEVKQKGETINSALAELPQVKNIFVKGLMVGIELIEGLEAKNVLAKCQQKGLLCLTAKTKLRLLPPLTVTQDEIEEAVRIIKNVLEEM